MSVSLLRLENRDIGLFYAIRHGWHDTRLHVRRSKDEGKSWGEAIRCIPAPGYFVTNNDRVVQLSTGRIVVPTNYHRMTGEDTVDWSSWDCRGIAVFYLSDDDGVSWREARQYCTLSVPNSLTGLQETGLIELDNGTLWAWFRTDMGTQYESFSTDMGETWSVPGPSLFRSPASPLSVKRIPSNNRLFAVWNPLSSRSIGWKRGTVTTDRTPLVYSVSSDEGKAWSAPVIIEDDEDTGFSYTAIHNTPDSVLLAYFIEFFEESRLSKRVLRMREIPISDLP